MATQGFANYIKKAFPNEQIKVAVIHDCRIRSRLFAETTANIFAANGFTVYLSKELRPTPELSFAIRHLGCKAGVNITLRTILQIQWIQSILERWLSACASSR